MRTMTLEELLMKEEDQVLLDIYNELEACVVPATGYAHAYCRKVNRLINEGQLCTIRDKYRNVYLPTLSKMIFKEMSRRYAMYCYNSKAPTVKVTPVERNDEQCTCEWCGIDDFEPDQLRSTDLGMLCDRCIEAIRSRGEDIAVYN